MKPMKKYNKKTDVCSYCGAANSHKDNCVIRPILKSQNTIEALLNPSECVGKGKRDVEYQ